MNVQKIISISRPALRGAVFFVVFVGIFSLFFQSLPLWYDLGKFAGNAAVVILWIACIPGILKRFKVRGILQRIQLVLMAVRRQLGILVFLLGLAHALWVRGFTLSFNFPFYQLLGVIALMIMVPLFLTSNNWAVRSLKKRWQYVHYLVYPAVWFILFHTFFRENELSLIGIGTLIIALLQIGSWVWYSGTIWKTKQR